jgi:hypothetical protein
MGNYEDMLSAMVSSPLTLEELYKINNAVVDRIKRQRRAENYQAIAKFHVGQKVVVHGNFGRNNGWIDGAVGVIEQIRQTKIKVMLRTPTVGETMTMDLQNVTYVTVNARNVEPYVEKPKPKTKAAPRKRAPIKKR